MAEYLEPLHKHNIDILMQLVPGTKMYVDKESNKLYIDDRYIQGIRRWLTNDSRKDILEPIKSTFDYFKGYNYLVTCHIAKKIGLTFKEIYPDFEELHNLIQNYSIIEADFPILVNYFITSKIKPSEKLDIITSDQGYELQPGFVLIIMVGGGAGGGCGGAMYRGGGGSGYVTAHLMYVPKSTQMVINIGEGGSFGHAEGDTYIKPLSGSPTSIMVGTTHYIAKGGCIPKKAVHGGDGFSGGGAGSIYNVKGGDGGSGTPGEDSDKFIGGISIKENYIDELLQLYPQITIGKGGKGGSTSTSCYASGGGGGGIIISTMDQVVEAESGASVNNDNNGHGGIGYGAGGGGGSYYTNSYHKKNYYGNGGKGANGCVIINYVDYDF